MRTHERRRGPRPERIELGMSIEDASDAPLPPWDDPVRRAEFAQSQRETGRWLGLWYLAGGALVALGFSAPWWLGREAAQSVLFWAVFVFLILVVFVGMVRAAVEHGKCPFCGEGFAVPEGLEGDEPASGSWNHCYSCRVRLR